jgi:hypothetical protein
MSRKAHAGLLHAWYACRLVFSSQERAMVRCCECGLLATRGDESDETCEATQETRESGLLNVIHWSNSIPGFGLSPNARFFCYAKSPFWPDKPPAGANEPESFALVRQIEIETKCPHFREYLPGRPPKEHEEMAFLETVRAEQKRFEARAEATAERRHNELREDQEKYHRQDAVRMRIYLLLTCLSVACAMFTVWMSYRPDHAAAPKAVQTSPAPRIPPDEAGK